MKRYAKFGYAAPFRFRVILEKPQGGGAKMTPPPGRRIIAILKAAMYSLKQISTQLLLTSHVNTGLKTNVLLLIIFHSHSLFRLEFSTPTPRQKCNFGTLLFLARHGDRNGISRVYLGIVRAVGRTLVNTNHLPASILIEVLFLS